MKNGLLLALSMVMNLVSCGIIRNDFCKRDVKNPKDLFRFNAACSLVSMLLLLLYGAMAGALSMPSLYTVALGALFGVVTALCALLHMMALSAGPLSYTSTLVSFAMIIPALSGLVFFGESVSSGQWVGAALMLVSIACAVEKTDEGTNRASLKWLACCLGAFLMNGLVGILQKTHQNSPHREELVVFLTVSFAVGALVCLLVSRASGKSGEKALPGGVRRFWIYALISGAGIALCNQVNLYLSGALPSILFFPVVNGGGMLLTVGAGLILWKERLSPRQWFGMAAGIAAILLLCFL